MLILNTHNFFLIFVKKKIEVIDFGKNANFLKIRKINKLNNTFNVFLSIKNKKLTFVLKVLVFMKFTIKFVLC